MNLPDLADPRVLEILEYMKQFLKYEREQKLEEASIGERSEKFTEQFPQFAEDHDIVFQKLVCKDKLETIVSILYYRDRVARGMIDEKDLAMALMKKYGSEKKS